MEKDILIEKVKLDCPFCNKCHTIEKRQRNSKIKIKNEVIEYQEVYLVCPETIEEENEYVTAKIMDENLLRAKELGEITITRYETKLIQDETYDKIMRLVNDNAMLALDYLQQNKSKFKNQERYELIENNIKKIVFRDTLNYLNKQEIEAKYIDYFKENIENGNKLLDIEKLEALLNYIAKNHLNLYKVKLMKILWYIDCLAYQKNNKTLTGLVYTHQKMGALPIAYDEIIKLSSIKIEEEINEYNDNYQICYHIVPNEEYKGKKLTNEEKEICDKVINKFKEFKTKEIVEYMHKEKAYTETNTNDVIDFSYAKYVKI